MIRLNYLVSDLHGFFDSFCDLLQLINFGKEDTLYILGDVIDRGPQPVALLQLIMSEPNMHLLLGNHEDMLLGFLHDGVLARWMRNGGGVTLNQWQRLTGPLQLELTDFLRSCPLYLLRNQYLLVHSGLHVADGMRAENPATVLALQEKNQLIWSREEFFNRPALSQVVTIFGHTSTGRIRALRGLPEEVPFTIWQDELYQDKIGIDCGSYNPTGGQLGCLRLEDLQQFYVPTVKLQNGQA